MLSLVANSGRICGRPCVARFRGRAQPAKSGMGVVLYSYGIRSRQEKGFADPAAFVAFCRTRRGRGVQVALGVRDDAAARKLRDRAEANSMCISRASSALPRDAKDLDRFDAEIRTAAACGADGHPHGDAQPAAATRCSRTPTTPAVRRRGEQVAQAGRADRRQAQGPARGRESQGLARRRT